ncbi:hypothetical protein H0E87_003728 [Populus deltoides]|jgi:hypothetical protein|uniref:Uncharacterized protein n=1 Tax=Populus deltoides TaxID=3696 RepID=A0A8T2ZCC7_POPDE|nr:hypothetical protein H0E87_003728 [Populus deltoides]
MASIDYEPKLLAVLSISFFLSCIFVSVAALDSALLASEGKALVESGWWSDYSNLISFRCMWLGIVCDRAGNKSQAAIGLSLFIPARDFKFLQESYTIGW